MDRRVCQLTPAGVFRISLPEHNITNMVVRVGSLKEEQDGSITVKVVQDVFGLPSTVYSSSQPQGQWTPPDTALCPVTQQRLLEIPYASLAAGMSTADLNALTAEICMMGILAVAPTATSINYTIQSRTGSADYLDHGTGTGRQQDYCSLILTVWTVLLLSRLTTRRLQLETPC